MSLPHSASYLERRRQIAAALRPTPSLASWFTQQLARAAWEARRPQ